jgi:hypothetical protein
MADRNHVTEEAVQRLDGTFAGIERALFEKGDVLEKRVEKVEQRLEQWEKRQPPAA